MSKYTTQVRYIVETNSTEGKPIGERIDEALPAIFNFDYPIWNEGYRRILERKIIMHYFNKETNNVIGLWKFYLEERLNLIMPLYNKMYETTVKDYDWLTDINYTEEFNSNKTNDNKSTNKQNATDTITNDFNGTVKDSGKDTIKTNASENNKSLISDLPQANYAGVDYGTNLTEGNNTNITNSDIDKNNTTETNNKNTGSNVSVVDSNNTALEKSTEVATRTQKGYRTIPTDLLMKYRESLINIDKMIIEELYDLFMLIY